MSNFMYDQRVLYLNLIISSLIVSVYLALKWPKLKKLSDQDTSLTIERWSLHFSVEIAKHLS